MIPARPSSPALSQPPVDLNRVLQSVSRLRPLPMNVTRILRAMDDPATSAGSIADLISLDQALAAYVLRVANSAHLGYATSCASLNTAVMRLGFKQMRALVMSTVAAGPLTRRLSGYRLGNGELWQHSVIVASMARWLAQALNFPTPEEVYVAGLLHDIGKLLLDQFVLTDYHKIIETMSRNKTYLWQVEEQMFGIDHAGVGGLMASQWGFPISLVDSIKYHHQPGLASSQQKVAAIVNIANAFAPDSSHSLSALNGRVVHPNAMTILGLDLPALERLKTNLYAVFKENASQLPAPPPAVDVGL
jgi:putative nucleotidyltransferase with HDIG domain